MDYVPTIGHLHRSKFAKVGQKCCQIKRKNCPRLKILPKWRNVAKSGHTATYQTGFECLRVEMKDSFGIRSFNNRPKRSSYHKWFKSFIFFGSMHKCLRTQNSKNQLINKSMNPSDKNITVTGHLCTRRGSSSSPSTAQAGSERRYPDRHKCIRHKRKIRTGPWPRTGRWLVHADHRRENTSSRTSRRFLKY